MVETEPEIRDVGAERAILGGIAKFSWDAYCDVDDIIQPRTFTSDSNRVIYQCFKYILDRDNTSRIDMPLIESTAANIGVPGFFEKIDERKYLRAVMNTPVELANVRRFAATIRKLEIGRLLREQLLLAGQDLVSITGSETIGHILGLAENRIFDFTSLLNDASQEPKNLGEDIVDFVTHLLDNPRENVGISSGFPILDRCIGGGFRNGLNMFAARMKVGKTHLGINFALHIARVLGIPVLYLDTEMTKEEHQVRSLANLSSIDSLDIERGMVDDKRDALLAASRELAERHYDFESVSGLPFEDVIAIMRRWVTKKVGLDENGKVKPCVIIYDYIKLCNSEGVSADMKEYQLLGFQATALQNFAIKYQLPIVSFAQLNRDGISRESTGSVGGSDRIAMYCANLTILKDKSPEEIQQDGVKHGTKKLVQLIARHGPSLQDGDYISVNANLAYSQMVEGLTCSQIHGRVMAPTEVDTDESLQHDTEYGVPF